MHERATLAQGVRTEDLAGLQGIVVGRSGTATVIWSAWADAAIFTADDPPAPDDPQDPTHGVRRYLPQPYLSVVDPLAVDGADVQTLVYDEYLSTKRRSNLVLSDRVAGEEWSRSPAKAEGREVEDDAGLAVNASGAAVLMWGESRGGGGEHVYAMYRDGAGAGWTAPQRVPAPLAFELEVGIDDAGRIVLVYDRIFDEHEGVWAIRRSQAGAWGKSWQLSGPGTELFGMAVGAGGAAVAIHGHVDGEGRPNGPHFASRMSSAGRWGAPVQQPADLGFGRTLGINANGRALIVGWAGAALIGRWSGSDGQWRKPFVLAADVPKTTKRGLSTQVAMNRRGDAVVAWGAKGRISHVWARYKPVGQQWTPPVRLTRADKPPQLFRVAIGDCGHVAFAWVATGDDRELQVLRASPLP